MSKLYTLFALPLVAVFAAAQTPCDQLKLSIPDMTVSSIQLIPAGPFVAPSAAPADAPAPARAGALRDAADVVAPLHPPLPCQRTAASSSS